MTLLTSEAAEKAIIGALMVDNARLIEVNDVLRPEHFAFPEHEALYKAIIEKVDAGQIANPITLKTSIENGGLTVNAVASYVTQSVPAVVNLRHYAHHIVDLYAKRRLYAELQASMYVLENNDKKPAEAITHHIMGRLADIAEDSGSSNSTTLSREIDAIAQAKPVRCISTGLRGLDVCMLGGFNPGRLYAVAARKKVGKTMLIGTILRNMAASGEKVLLITAEMGNREIAERVAGGELGVNSNRLREPDAITPGVFDRLGKAANKYDGCVDMYHKPGLRFPDLKAKIYSSMAHKGVSGFILDYWQLVQPAEGTRSSTSEHLDKVAQWLAEACKRFGCWGLVMAQLNQEGNTRGSEGLRLACDQMYKLCRKPKVNRPDQYERWAWLEMTDTRYTAWCDAGSEDEPSLVMSENGTHFDEI